jgi:hypothetical protein
VANGLGFGEAEACFKTDLTNPKDLENLVEIAFENEANKFIGEELQKDSTFNLKNFKPATKSMYSAFSNDACQKAVTDLNRSVNVVKTIISNIETIVEDPAYGLLTVGFEIGEEVVSDEGLRKNITTYAMKAGSAWEQVMAPNKSKFGLPPSQQYKDWEVFGLYVTKLVIEVFANEPSLTQAVSDVEEDVESAVCSLVDDVGNYLEKEAVNAVKKVLIYEVDKVVPSMDNMSGPISLPDVDKGPVLEAFVEGLASALVGGKQASKQRVKLASSPLSVCWQDLNNWTAVADVMVNFITQGVERVDGASQEEPNLGKAAKEVVSKMKACTVLEDATKKEFEKIEQTLEKLTEKDDDQLMQNIAYFTFNAFLHAGTIEEMGVLVQKDIKIAQNAERGLNTLYMTPVGRDAIKTAATAPNASTDDIQKKKHYDALLKGRDTATLDLGKNLGTVIVILADNKIDSLGSAVEAVISDAEDAAGSKPARTLESHLKELRDGLGPSGGFDVAVALTWCEENGADELSEIAEVDMVDDFVASLELKPVKAKKLKEKLRAL